jgi:hypothetical protein
MHEVPNNLTQTELLSQIQKQNRNAPEARVTKAAMVRVVNSRNVQQADLSSCNHITLTAIRSVIEHLEAERDRHKKEVLHVMALRGFKC